VVRRSLADRLADPPSDYNYERDANGKCVLVPGAEPLPPDTTCAWDQSFWNERTPYRKVPHSSCSGGYELDKGTAHPCPGHRSHGLLWWLSVLLAPVFLAALFGLWWSRRHGGAIRLPEPGSASSGGGRNGGGGPGGAMLGTLMSVPYWLLGVSGAIGGWLDRQLSGRFARRRGGYRSLHVDDDACVGKENRTR